MLSLHFGIIATLYVCANAVPHNGFDHRHPIAANNSGHENRRKERLFQLNIMDYFWDMTNSLGGLAISSGSSIIFKPRKCRCKCGVANQRNSRLLGGTDLAPFEFPWLVNIHVKTVSSVPGTLINDRYVLTAASSMKGMTPFDIKVAIGLHDICHSDVTSTIHSALAIILHPEYITKTRQNDLALVRLSETVRFGELVSPICLPAFETSVKYEHLVTTIATWIKEGKSRGRTTMFNVSRTSCLPRKVGLPVLDVSTCSEAAAKTQGCLGVVGAPSVLCSHDAGSGVMFKNKNSYIIIGVLSDLQHCGYPINIDSLESIHDFSLPMFTRVVNHLTWIRQNTKDGCSCNP